MHKTIIHHTIPFHDIDIMEIAWHGHYLKYFELARTGFMQSLNLDLPELRKLGIAMPVVTSVVEHRVPIFYNETVAITASCEDLYLPYLKLEFKIHSSAGELKAWGMTKQVYTSVAPPELLFNLPEPIEARYKEMLDQRQGDA